MNGEELNEPLPEVAASMKANPPGFQKLLDYLKQTRGFDFSLYKPSSLSRRIQKQMQLVGIGDYEQYVDYLEVHPEEFGYLFNMILINVTGFFRDPEAWDYLRDTVVPGILASHERGDQIRVWSAGCASGEEAYTLAIVLAEAMGMQQFRERVKIYATDLDDEALNYARQASYGTKEVALIPPDLLEKYFEESAHRYLFHRDLRGAVIFGRHDLIQDAPISRIDLLVCRNVVMYFNAEAQARILSRFHFALNGNGYLFLGKAEMLFTHGHLFTPVELKRRIFQKVIKGNPRERLLVMAQAGTDDMDGAMATRIRIREATFQADPLAQVVVDVDGYLILANDKAYEMFGVGARDTGRPLRDLELSYRPVDLRSGIDEVMREKHTVVSKGIEWRRHEDDVRCLDVQLIPLVNGGGALIGVKIIFDDVTRFQRLQEDQRHSKHELEVAYEELLSSNEELVTTNEELQSTVEELETTNEELQSTNEELETMNEELQSTNEELETINAELRQRGDELRQVNAFLESILTSLRAGVVVIDQNMRIHIWNSRSEDLWGLRSSEVRDRHLMTLDTGLPVEALKPLIRACLAGDPGSREAIVPSTNRRGKSFPCRVTGMPLVGNADTIHGVILLMEEYYEGEH